MMFAIGPMVKQSDYCFRKFVRDETTTTDENVFRLGSKQLSSNLLAYSPMLVAHDVLTKPDYLSTHLYTNSDEHDLVVQIAGCDADELCEASRKIVKTFPNVCAIDLNLGWFVKVCLFPLFLKINININIMIISPQPDANERFYGAYMAQNIPLTRHCVSSLVSCCATELSTPVTCKVLN